MPLQATSGAASYDGFGGGVAVVPTYIEEVFSTWLYTGNGSTGQTITNGIDLSTKGGLVWFKPRNTGNNHNLIDSARGINKFLISNATNAEGTASATFGVGSFNSDGFSLLRPWTSSTNTLDTTQVSWTFRKQPKFFDVLTYTGDGSAPRNIAHNLNSTPGCIIIKKTNGTGDWWVWHRATSNANANLYLNYTDAADSGANPMISAVSSTTFTLATNQSATMNASGDTYVAYIFAHNAGGFGLTGTDNVISCGSFTSDGSGNATINLGYEPQWIMIKATTDAFNSNTNSWNIYDTMRGWPVSGNEAILQANVATEETSAARSVYPSSTGFNFVAGRTNQPFIYITIRRPMKVPTSGTSVYNAVARTGTNADATISGVGFSPDLILGMTRSTSNKSAFVDRLRGINPTAFLQATGDDVESSLTSNMGVTGLTMDGVSVDIDNNVGYVNFSTRTYLTHFFRRAPGFFDEVCYKATNVSSRQITHGLASVPELIIVKDRTASGTWFVYHKDLIPANKMLGLNSTSDTTGFNAGAAFGDGTTAALATASVFTVGNSANWSTNNFVAYLFATCPGVSKVGSYTGDGTDGRIIDCGFTSGARFVLIKSTSNTGNWWVWDTARGIVSANDPVLRLNTTAAESTNSDDLDPSSSGFIVNYNGLFAINESGWSYIFLAIA